MDDAEIKLRLEKFCDDIFCLKSIGDARALEKELDAFCEENHVSFEQRQIIAESGAGEVLYMLVTAPTE